ncbi:MAG: gamma-glutamylcyclotransferase [Pseudonocardiaceae bacterium]
MFVDADYPADPYPGRRPDASFVHSDGVGHRLVPGPPPQTACSTPHARSGYVLASTVEDLDRWLAARDAAPLGDRTAVLAYGSNACPQKITWLRENLCLSGPVVVLRARCTGLTAVWASGVRARDGQRPVTLAAAPGIVEDHAVLLVTADQLAAIDRCEGAGDRYNRVLLDAAAVTIEGGWVPQQLHAYVGARADRLPLLVDGTVLRAAEVPHDDPRLGSDVDLRDHCARPEGRRGIGGGPWESTP